MKQDEDIPIPESPEAAQKRALRQKEITSHLTLLKQWIEALASPEDPTLGQDFSKKFIATACRETIDDTLNYDAVFNSFIYPPDPGFSGFTNMILYGKTAAESLERFFLTMCHEHIHAMQYFSAAIMHADPFNAATNIVLCPRDYVTRKQLIEEDAYAKAAWLCALASADHPLIVEETKGMTMSVAQFQEIMARHETIQASLREAAFAVGATEGLWIKDAKTKAPLADAWHTHALGQYKGVLEERMKEKQKPTFVRMDETDMLSIGKAFGPNPFGDNTVFPEFRGQVVLSAENQRLLEELNARAGITDEQSLPTFREALEARGLTPEEFIAASRAPAKAVPGKALNSPKP